MSGHGGAVLAAPAPTVLFSFRNLRGVEPATSLLTDGAGNLYGTTAQGGGHNVGVVFELTRTLAGQTAWTETVLHLFDGADGANPNGALIADSAGNLYGTTNQGGANNVGAVFELSPPAGGKTGWTETVLLSFDGTNGAYPEGALLADAAGNLYGATYEGGASHKCGSNGSCGVVFELSPPGAGQMTWSETVLFTFDKSNGHGPVSGLIADSAGNLYGTTQGGGAHDAGVVFELTRPLEGQTAWPETVLHSFDGADGRNPNGVLIADGAGNLYGTTGGGGIKRTTCRSDRGCGVAFELSPPTAGQTTWTETVLHTFNGADGYLPDGGLIADGAGNLFGMAALGGKNNACPSAFGCGLVFELRPPAGGETVWTETVLHSFNGTKGLTPSGGLIADGAGNLYGTTQSGGAHDDGVVFELAP
jgi:uncharacterized repeat protein (TIGR03803 family)